MTRRTLLSAAVVAALPEPRRGAAQTTAPRWIQIADEFRRGSNGWLPGFSDYGFEQGGMDRLAEVRALPPEVNPGGGRRGYLLQGENNSDDLFMFLKKPLSSSEGVAPGASYAATFFIELASDAPSGCVGIGGAPGESVYLKAGASAVEPVAALEGESEVRINVDKGEQARGGTDATVLGTVANGADCTPKNIGRFRLITRRGRFSPVRASATGMLWLFVGTDSGFEGLTRLYYARIVVALERLDEGAA